MRHEGVRQGVEIVLEQIARQTNLVEYLAVCSRLGFAGAWCRHVAVAWNRVHPDQAIRVDVLGALAAGREMIDEP